jgi:hypothetical protein
MRRSTDAPLPPAQLETLKKIDRENMRDVSPRGSLLDLNDGLYLIGLKVEQLAALKKAQRDGRIKLARIIDRDAKYATVEVPNGQSIAGLKRIAPSARLA